MIPQKIFFRQNGPKHIVYGGFYAIYCNGVMYGWITVYVNDEQWRICRNVISQVGSLCIAALYETKNVDITRMAWFYLKMDF